MPSDTPNDPAAEEDRSLPAASNACLALTGLAGVGILAWWGVVFHPSNSQLWMVPVGLIMVGTPLFVCLSLSASSCRRRFSLLFSDSVLPDDPEK
ncbi:uncharacterized protein LOC122023476 [Zingiber officinale]|uniref:uncharacterized protein LOC122023476 n=1 Tax=Zingiber officinale TaxID=94328 RepID=UPI001C4AFBAE|nr:uncharacterized protein LOC122023476 [Zingiber officinale]